MNLTVQTCQWLEDKGWLSQDAKVYLEAESKQQFIDALPKNWRLLKSKKAGEVGYHLLKISIDTNHIG